MLVSTSSINDLLFVLAQKMRAAHCMLDYVGSKYCKNGDRQMVEQTCGELRWLYRKIFEDLEHERKKVS